MTIQEKQRSMHEKDLQRLNELCLMDDDFFSEALDGKKEAVEYILNTVLEREDLKVVSTSAQVYVIFITENDKFKEGVPVYHIERKITENNNALFEDGAHIIYVNGEFQNLEHPIGRLMHDFTCKKASDILNPVLAEEVRYLKETEGGKGQMSRILEEMREETAMEAEHKKAVETAQKMLARGRDTVEDIAEITGLTLEEVQELAS